jgi:formate dehydrogenase major subunit
MASTLSPDFHFSLNGREALAHSGESILLAAKRHGVEVPHLCFKEGLRPDGNCRACVVEVQGERVLAPSCCRAVVPGMVVQTDSERALKSQRMVLELLLSDLPTPHLHINKDGQGGQADVAATASMQFGELSDWAKRMGVQVRTGLQGQQRAPVPADTSHPAIAVNLDACIQCGRCVRACREEQVNNVIGMAWRGVHSQVVFDVNDTLGASSCVACGECVQACPTGALMSKTLMGDQVVDKQVDSVCPFCGVGCQLTYQVKGNTVIGVQGRDGPANHGRLCVKGRYGFDYIHHPHRLTQPLIRRTDVPKDVNVMRDPADWAQVFRPATWDEALDLAAGGFTALKSQFGPKSLAGFGSAKGSNEEAYLFQKLVRTGFGSNNVDHCTRLCHASSVAALLEGVGSGAVSNQISDVALADVVLVIGSNTSVNHPVAATWMKNAAKRGTRIITADPRGVDLSQHAWRHLQFTPDTDVALLNALIYTVFDEGLTNQAFVAERVDNVAAIRAGVQAYSPEVVAPLCGIPAATLREVARAYATAPAAMIFWGMGVSQHTHGTDNVRALIALCMVCGQIGRPGTGLHPLRGQNNVQGASDAGLLPMMFPNYLHVDDSVVHAWYESYWGCQLDAQPGYTVVEIMGKALAPETDPHKVRGMFVQGENPAMSDPDLTHTRQALAGLSHLVVQDIFMTETAWMADVVLPASAWPEKAGTVSNTDRMMQLGRQAVEPPGDARADLWIIQQLAKRLGLVWSYPGAYHGVAAVHEEMRLCLGSVITGITWERIEREGCVTYPCLNSDDPGQPTVFIQRFPTPNGRAQLVPADQSQANELPTPDYPLVLITGRQLEHWHTGSMSRRSEVLDALEPVATASVNGRELTKRGLAAGSMVNLRSLRGSLQVQLRQDDGTPDGTVFMAFAYREAAANLLTNPALDPVGKIPEFKYCAVALDLLP